MAVTYQVETITPEIARELLKHNRVNRNISNNRVVYQYAEDMKSGKWQLNYEPIHIYEDGSVANAQHRLSAVIIADRPVQFLVVRNVPLDVTIYDRGRNRNAIDSMLLKGYSKDVANATTTAMAKLHYAIQLGRRNVSDGAVEKFIVKNADLLTELLQINKSKTGRSRMRINTRSAVILLPCFYALNAGACKKEDIVKFLSILRSGFMDNINQSAAIVCRNDMYADRIKIKGGVSERIKSVYQIEKALCDFVSRTQRRMSYANNTKPIYSNLTANKEEAA